MTHPILTDRQAVVLQLMCDGQHSQHEVAETLGISRSTLAQHLAAIRRRLERKSIDALCELFSTNKPTPPR